MFVEKLLLKHSSCVHPFISCQISFSGTFHSYMAHKTSNTHSFAIYKISLLTIIKDENASGKTRMCWKYGQNITKAIMLRKEWRRASIIYSLYHRVLDHRASWLLTNNQGCYSMSLAIFWSLGFFVINGISIRCGFYSRLNVSQH